MAPWLLALLAGLVAGGALLLGSAVAWFLKVPGAVVAGIMAFGAGVLISALTFELVSDAMEQGGLAATSGGFLAGAVIYVGLNLLLARYGARHRKRSGDQQPSEADRSGSGGAIAIGALLDGVPESMVLGLSVLAGPGLSVPMFAAVFISNVPEGLSSSAGWKAAGRSRLYVFGIWGAIALASGIASLAGYALLDGAAPATLAVVNALAAGAILAMITDTMIPEAFAEDSLYSGLLATLGFLAALTLHAMG
ncbi:MULTISPECIES: ZIP family metal transporter [Brachybacterium]|uniref:ZIP family zinc transporter n=1 Tax=Brachybacterium alimentarium TaxID=47845 RepID=A0A2A3YG94_9MICO|nr:MULTISPECIES: ZIP family zinc transporter [Brachybacterium]PCC38259.1 ZIP family zinc transporter [Brachybacterium alimentarium]RCS64031.1 ZIP family zinc transporter [Brachybacterium sp. JB7]RCS71923.1 ZIP family zinc transporter [Brachybacterium alimentarium]RCS74283.1 ZIP family zinc transporter [Brachybacterium alimentarium]RCS78242.1 ZIP family zinc transporter [Brachybacterium alimentarium]